MDILTKCVPFWVWLLVAGNLAFSLYQWRKALMGWRGALSLHRELRRRYYGGTDRGA